VQFLLMIGVRSRLAAVVLTVLWLSWLVHTAFSLQARFGWRCIVLLLFSALGHIPLHRRTVAKGTEQSLGSMPTGLLRIPFECSGSAFAYAPVYGPTAQNKYTHMTIGCRGLGRMKAAHVWQAHRGCTVRIYAQAASGGLIERRQTM
jgi:hypothetical protein